MYGTGQTMSHNMSKQQTSQGYSSSAGYVGYGSGRSQSTASAGYSSTSQGGSSAGYSNVGSSQASSAATAAPKPRQAVSKVGFRMDFFPLVP